MPSKFIENNWREVDFYIDIEGELTNPNVQKALNELSLIVNKITEVGTPEVPWFPTRIEDFDFIGKRVLSEGDGIQESDHASFRDPVYRERRDMIAGLAFDYRISEGVIPNIDYTSDEIATWNYCYPKLKKMLVTNACEETN